MRVARETSGFAVRERRICWYCPLIYLKGGSEERDTLYEGGERDLSLGGQREEDLLVLVHQQAKVKLPLLCNWSGFQPIENLVMDSVANARKKNYFLTPNPNPVRF
jgi:hypothetical protein